MQIKTSSQKDRSHNAQSPGLQGTGHLQAIINSLDDELMAVDHNLRITQVNSFVLQRHGGDKSKVIGRHCYEVSHGLTEPCSSPECECPIKKVWDSGKPERVTHIHQVNVGDKTEERYYDIIATPVKDSRGDITEVVELMRDTTEARNLEKQLIEANRSLSILNAVAGAVSQSMDLDTILETALDKVLEAVGANAGAIMLLDSESQTLSHRAHRGLSEEFLKGVGELKVGEGIVGKVAESREPICLDDISQSPGVARRALVAKERHRAFCSVPLQSKDRVLGVMNVSCYTQRQFSKGEVELLTNIANQIAVAIENASLYNEIQRKEQMRGELLRMVISKQEEERKRIARELHDETSQALTGLAVNLEAVMNELPLHTRQLKQKLLKIQAIAINTLEGIHRAIYELRPSLLDDLGLVAAVNWHAETSLEAAGVKVRVDTVGEERRLPIQVETALFRIAQEAGTNIVRHAGADSASVAIHFKDNSAAIRIEDNGSGFDLNKVIRTREKERGLGLLGMKERAEFLGGWLTIRSRPGFGTQIAAEIPVEG